MEAALLTLIRQKFLSEGPGNSEKFEKEMKVKLSLFSRDLLIKQNLIYFDLISWAESKVMNIPFVEIVRAKARA
jgi:hypothetical protein